ncbi:caspase-3-like [Hemicordylus capensis]|uniref:caspase-3-like n=1 Tax=Hemicordylus capensis TaxID=884348 RepID=UPI0023025D43|nr:caspase-3-like [Hemicordylus capensis]
MAHQRQNRALIIVNSIFYGKENHLENRQGAEREANKLFIALSNCNYAVQLHHNLTVTEIVTLYEKECQENHGDYFVSIISSHGDEGIIYDCEGQPVQLTQIYQALSPQRCHNLAGKPKIFFIQACRGEEIDPGVETDGAAPQINCFSHYSAIPEDTAVMFACSPGYASFINRWESMFLKVLLRFLEGEERHLELTSFVTRINFEVAYNCQARGRYGGGKEMPCFVTKMVRGMCPFSQRRQALGHSRVL